MVRSFGILAASGLATSMAAAQATNNSTGYKPNFRTSPLDGSKIALPTKEQLAFQENEIGVLIHFDPSQYLGLNGCNEDPGLVPKPDLFDPASLDTDQWMDAAATLGAKFATLVAKHNCGFATWPTEVQFPLRDNTTQAYNYTITESPVEGFDLVKSFKESAEERDIKRGLYYSVNVNNFLNVQDSVVRDVALEWGQVGITNETYDEIVMDQLAEVWSGYGDLTEIWFDGGYSDSQMDPLIELLEKYQPQAAIFNGCDTEDTCVNANGVRWIGNEMGEAPEENWSTGLTNDGGDAESPFFCPSVCDTTMQVDTQWFFNEDKALRPLSELIDVYHTTVGRNCILELNLTPGGDGLVPEDHVELYEQLGGFISSCYGEPVGEDAEHEANDEDGTYSIRFGSPQEIDRVVLMEDQADGQVIRSYEVHGKVAGSGEGWNATAPDADSWSLLSEGTSIGHKKIDLFDEAVKVSEVRVSTTFADTPKWRSVSVHLCDEPSSNGTAPSGTSPPSGTAPAGTAPAGTPL